MNFELAYKDSLKDLLFNGYRMSNRTCVDTFVKEHQFFELDANELPVLKGKKVFPKYSLVETIWMMLGRNDVKWLNDRGVKYWDKWADENGTIGKSYGYQFRNFGGVDQLQTVVNQLLTDPTDRRIIINLYNPADLNEMTLPPCVHSYQFTTLMKEPNKVEVSLHVTARSNDAFLGVPYDLMNAVWILNLVTDYVNLKSENIVYKPNKVYYTANNYHLYANHVEQAVEYIRNVEMDPEGLICVETEAWFDSVPIRADYTIDEYLEAIAYNYDKLECTPEYKSYGMIKAPIAV